MPATNYEKPHNITLRVWEKTCCALCRRAVWHAERAEHSRLTEVLPSRVMDSVLHSLTTHPHPFIGEEDYQRAALNRYERYLNRNLNRNRARLLQGAVVSASDVPEYCDLSNTEQARQNGLNPQFLLMRETLPSESMLITCLLEMGVEEYIAYIWLWRCWQGSSYEDVRVRLQRAFGISCDAATLRQWVRRCFVTNEKRMAEFYQRVWGEEATADMLARLRAPRRVRHVPDRLDAAHSSKAKPAVIKSKSAGTEPLQCPPQTMRYGLALPCSELAPHTRLIAYLL